MSGVAIVAIPNKSDPVWAVSSEKIPHMTLLFLGDALSKEDYRQVQEFVTHVADVTLPSFGMSVDKRDTLGDSDADVLFFKNNDKSRISLFRSYLLQDSIIREAYESVEQFEGWTPHLTLGYPETPAKKDPREDSEFYWVNFDRIMIWTGEYEGPEIELKSEDLELAMDGFDENLGLSQSDLDELDTFLAHFGVKGMRWGVRKDALTTGRYGSTHGPVRAGVRLGGDKRPSGIDKLSDKYNRTDLGKVTTTVTRVLSSGPYTAFQTASLVALTGATALSAGATAPVTATAIGAIIGQSAATHGLHAAWANKDNVRRINNNPKYKGKNLKTDKKLRKEYHDEQMHSLGRALWDPRGVRLAETRARVTGNPGDKSIVVRPYGLIEHSIEDVSLTIDVVYNDTGHILEFVPRVPEDIAKKFYEIVNNDGNMAQSDLDELDAFLAHFGVKGMRWGVRRSAEERRADRTARVQARSEKSIAKAKEYQTRAEAKTAVANAKTAAAKAKVATADAKTGEATARLETKVAKRETKLAKTEARTGVDDPANGYVRESSALAGKSDRQAVGNRKGAAKDVRTLDDQTLKAYTERLSTEKRLKDAIAEDTAPKKTAAKKLINDVGKDLAKKALIGAGSLAIYYVLSTKGGKEPYRVKSSAEGMGRLLSGAPKTSGKDAFTVPKFNSPPPPSINKRKAKSF